jgi:hypothetical protein
MKAVLLAFICLILTPTLFSQVSAPNVGVHQHDGFYLRMAGGIGYAQLVENDVMGSDLKFSGVAGASRFQIGGTVSDNLIIYGEFGGVIQTEPTMEWVGESGSTSDVKVSVFDFGGGITYYLMPVNVYFALGLLINRAELEFNNRKAESEYGIGFNAMVGKEWWVGEDWGIGATVYISYGTMKDTGEFEDNTINSFYVGVLFSATYN